MMFELDLLSCESISFAMPQNIPTVIFTKDRNEGWTPVVSRSRPFSYSIV